MNPHIWPVSNRLYHLDTDFVSHSMLEVFERSRPEFEARYVTKTIPAPDPSPAMLLGTAVHILVLQPDRKSLIKVAPKYEGEGAKKRKQDFLDSLTPDCIPLSMSDFDEARRMADAVRAHPLALEMITASYYTEVGLRGDLDGVPCKALLDTASALWGIGDLKTCDSIFDWHKTVYNRHYYRQAALHLDVAQYLDEPPSSASHICVDKSEMHEVAVKPLSQDFIDMGRAWYRPLLQELAACREAGIYSSRWRNQQPECEPLHWMVP